jgi:hypothetical protein
MATDRRLSYSVRSGDIEVGIVGVEIVIQRAGWVASMLRESCPTWLQTALTIRELRLPLAVATAHYSDGVLRIYRLGEPWLVLEGVSDHYVAMDFAEEVRRFRA